MTRIATAALLAIALAGCAAVREIRYQSPMLVHAVQGRTAFTWRITQQCGMVSAWVRPGDVYAMVAVCDGRCNCKLVKGPPPKPESGICR